MLMLGSPRRSGWPAADWCRADTDGSEVLAIGRIGGGLQLSRGSTDRRSGRVGGRRQHHRPWGRRVQGRRRRQLRRCGRPEEKAKRKKKTKELLQQPRTEEEPGIVYQRRGSVNRVSDPIIIIDTSTKNASLMTSKKFTYAFQLHASLIIHI